MTTTLLPIPRNLFTTTLDARYHSLNAATPADTAASHEVYAAWHLSGFDVFINTARPTGHASLGTPSSHAAATPASQRVYVHLLLWLKMTGD